MDSSMVQALVNYYLRQGLDSSVTDATGILLQRDPTNSFLEFWHAFGLYITGEASKASFCSPRYVLIGASRGT